MLHIRSAEPDADFPSVNTLYELGRLAGQTPENDSAADIDNLVAAYFSDEDGSHFWIAEIRPEDKDPVAVGMVGVQRDGTDSAEIRRLRVHPEHRQRGIGTRLMETALAFCQHRGYLKIVLDTRIERVEAIHLFERFGFQLNRTRDVHGKPIHDFYLDLYRKTNNHGVDTEPK